MSQHDKNFSLILIALAVIFIIGWQVISFYSHRAKESQQQYLRSRLLETIDYSNKADKFQPLDSSSISREYRDDDFGFSLAFPEMWKNVETKITTDEFPNTPPEKTIRFSVANEEMFALIVFDSQVWKILDRETPQGLKPKIIKSYNDLVFTYAKGQDPSEENYLFYQQIDNIIATFSR
jgi:hypothetical protein